MDASNPTTDNPDKPVRYHVDRLILAYLLFIFAIVFVSSYFGYYFLIAALVHIVLIFMVLRMSAATLVGPRAWIRWFYPLLIMIPLHFEVELLATLLHRGAHYDALVMVWDQWLFRGHPHRILPDQVFRGPLWRELFHLGYLSTYLILPAAFWWALQGPASLDGGDAYPGSTLARAWARFKAGGVAGPPAPGFLRFAFVFMGSFFTYLLIFILFPVVGPMLPFSDDRFLRFAHQGLLPRLLDLLLMADSAGGALPSSHVGLVVVLYLLLRPDDLRTRIRWLTALLVVTISVVYCSVHYGLDALAGLITGPLFYLLWSRIYGRLKPEETEWVTFSPPAPSVR